MGTPVDSLELQISAESQKANAAIDSIIRNLGRLGNALKLDTSNLANIGKNLDFSKITDGAKAMSETVGKAGANMAQSMKPVQEETKKIARTFEQVKDPFKDLGKGFRIEGTISDIQKAVQRYTNELERAKLKEQTLSTKGMTNTKSYENAVADVVKYENVLESLKNQLAEIQSKKVKIDFSAQGIEEVEQSIENIEESIQKSTGLPKTFYDAKAMSFVFGEAASDIENWTQAVEKFGNQAGKSLNESLEKGTETAREKIEELQKMFAESGKDFVFSGNSEQLDKEIEKVKSELDDLYKKQDKAIELGKIDTEPFKTLIRDIENAINRLGVLEAARPEALNRTLEENSEKARNAANQIKQFEANLQQLRVPPVQEDNIVKLQNALKKTEADLERLRIKLANGLSLGKITTNIDDSGYRNLREQIALTEKNAEALRQRISEIGTGSASGFERLKQSISGLSESIKTANKASSTLYATLKKLNSGVNSVFAKIGKLTKSMLSLGKSVASSGKGFNINLKTILKYGFGIRSIYMLVNKLRNAIKEGMKNLVQYSDETNQSVSMLASSLATLKNASAAAVSPLLNAIAPALNQLIQLFIRATNAVNQFISALMGKSTWIKAKDQVIDYADSISSASKAAKGALQPFDKLNNLTSQQTAGTDAGDMFETLPIENKFKDLVDWLKDMWKNADFYDLGRKIGEELQHGLANIPWDKIKSTARKLGKSLATLINGFVEVEGLGEAIGYSIAQALNTAFEFANAFAHNLNWESIGKFIADTINGFLNNIDWSLIRDTLITGAKGLADAINSFSDYLDWDAVAETISNSINALSDTIIMFFERTDWSELGHKIGYTLEKSIENIDFKRVGRAIADIIQSGLDFASGIIAELDWNEIKKAIKDLFTGFFENIKIPDNLKGIATALLGIKTATLALGGVMKTAKLAKAFSDISDASKKLQNIKLVKVFKDMKGAFTPLADAFKQFKNSFAVSGDLFGSFKNGLSSLSSGMEAFRSSLSPLTKGVVGLAAVFAEFKVVGNAFDDIIKGTGNLSTSIGKITAAAGAAAAALSVVFGVPAGIIIAGVTAAAAGLKSLNDNFNELEVERVGQRIKDSLTNPDGVSLDSIVDQYSDAFANLRGQFTNISDQASKVDMLDTSIRNVYQDIDKIQTSMKNGVLSVEEGTEQLRTLFADLEQITSEKFGAIEDTLYSAFGESGAYREAFESIGGNAQELLEKVTNVSVEAQDRLREINELQLTLDPLSEEYKRLEEEKRGITGSLDTVQQAFNQFSTDINSLNIDYSKLVDSEGLTSNFETTLTALTESGKAYQESIRESTNGIVDEFTNLANTARAMGDESGAAYWEEAIKATQESGKSLEAQAGETARQITDKIQSDFIDAISEQIKSAQSDWESLGAGEKLWMSITKGIDTQDEYVKAQVEAFKKNTLDPMSQEIDDALTQLGIDGAGWAENATEQIIGSLFDTKTIAKGTYVDVDSVLVSNWSTIFENVKESTKPKATETGKFIVEGISEGMKNVDFSSTASELFNNVLSTTNSAFGINSPAEKMKPSGQYITLGIVEGFKSKFDAFTAPIQQLCNLITQKISNGLQNMKNTWSNIWNALPSVVTGVINRITSSLSTLVSNISNAFNNISSRIRGIGSTISGVSSGGRSYSMPKIKGYAAGGFPEDGWFRASKGEYFGQFDDGTSYISNNTQIENGIASGVEQAAYRGMMRALKEAGGIGGSNVSVVLEGDAGKLFNVMQEKAEEYKKRTDRYAFS